MVKGKRTKKKVKTVEMYNIELIFSRVMYLLSANQIDLEDAFNYEFSLFQLLFLKTLGSLGSQNRNQFQKTSLALTRLYIYKELYHAKSK